jgi:3-isopropylmalate dehydrogenase
MGSHKIAVIPGDGIGPEVIDAARHVVTAAATAFDFDVELTDYDVSARNYLRTGALWTDELARELRKHDAVLFGALGDPAVPPGVLERGIILKMRSAFRQAVNLRPVRLYPGIGSPIKNLTPDRCDLVIIRENTEGAYAGGGTTIHAGTPNAVAIQDSINTRHGVERVVDYAFRLARLRERRLTLCHKKNILMEAGALWQDTVDDLSRRYPDVAVDYVHVDAMCYHLPTAPERFDVVVTDNLFGDIITDLGAVLQGGLGVAASANLNVDGSAPSMFEAIHGSAPDIAGRGLANPTGAILSAALCLASLGETEAAKAVEASAVAVQVPAAGNAAQRTGAFHAGDRPAGGRRRERPDGEIDGGGRLPSRPAPPGVGRMAQKGFDQ